MSNVAFWLRIRRKCMRAFQLSTVQRAATISFETFDMRSFEKVHVKRLTSHVKRLIQAHVKRLTVDNFKGLACQTSRLQAGAPRQKGWQGMLEHVTRAFVTLAMPDASSGSE